MPDALRGVAQREDQVPGIVAGESPADPQIVRGARLQAAKAILDEGQPGIAGGVLGQVLRDERLEGANPEQRHQAERQVHEALVASGPRQAAGAVGDPDHRPQQGEFVGRGLAVVEHHVPEQRKGAGAVVREPEPDDLPRDPVPPQDVGNAFAANRLQAVPPGQHFHIVGGGRLHRPIRGRWPLAQRQHHAAAGTHHRDQLAERPRAGARRHMHPHRAQPDQVEGEFRAQDLFLGRQRVVEPADVGGRVECFAQVAHFCCGLGRDDLVAVGGEPGGVATAAGAHVEDVGAGVWEEVEDGGVDLVEQEVFVIAHPAWALWRCSWLLRRGR